MFVPKSMITKEDTKEQFARTSHSYLTSATHEKDIDLDIILLLLQPKETMSVLDIATGAGHTALKVAPHVKEVVAADLTEEMLERVKELQMERNIANVKTMLADAEDLPFEDGAFDAATCRIAPHHFLKVQKAITEVARVLKPDGVFILEDSISPLENELDMFINTAERVRDRTHIRSYSLPEWHAFAAHARFAVEETLIYRKRHDIEDWISRAGISATEKSAVIKIFREAAKKAKSYYEITFDMEGSPIAFTDDKVLFRLRKY
jgi:ubiquinone/menaquinone biosynthesis C-methylase UbiE